MLRHADGDARQAFSSADGVTWKSLPGLRDVTSCNDVFVSLAACGLPANGGQARGIWLKGYTPELGGGGIFRSADGKSWSHVSQTNVEAFAFGYAPP